MILKSQKYLGDTIHSYFIVKKLNEIGIDIKLLTKDDWKFLFEEQFLSKEICDKMFSIDGEDKLPHFSGRHARDRILHMFTGGNAPSSPLNIPPQTPEHIILCQRASKSFKHWNGDWKYIKTYLENDGFKVVYDLSEDDLETLINKIVRSHFIISVDTACVHIAEAYGIPVIGLYGATSLNLFGPYSNKNFCIQKTSMKLIKELDIIFQIDKIKRKILSQG